MLGRLGIGLAFCTEGQPNANRAIFHTIIHPIFPIKTDFPNKKHSAYFHRGPKHSPPISQNNRIHPNCKQIATGSGDP